MSASLSTYLVSKTNGVCGADVFCVEASGVADLLMIADGHAPGTVVSDIGNRFGEVNKCAE